MSLARRAAPALVLLVALLATLLPSPAVAATDTGSEAASLAEIDAERSARGLPALRRSAELQAVARRHAVRMADDGSLHHNPELGSEVSGWRQVGENVGRGPSADAVHRAFMDSASHRDNILSASFVEVGVGVERRGDVIWVTQVFRLPAEEPAPAPAAQPAPAPTAEPEPARPAPRPTAAPAPAPTSARVAPPAAPPLPEAGIGIASASRIVPVPAPAVSDRLVALLAEIDASES